MFVWDRGKEANAGLVKQPFSYHGFHKLVVRPDKQSSIKEVTKNSVKVIVSFNGTGTAPGGILHCGALLTESKSQVSSVDEIKALDNSYPYVRFNYYHQVSFITNHSLIVFCPITCCNCIKKFYYTDEYDVPENSTAIIEVSGLVPVSAYTLFCTAENYVGKSAPFKDRLEIAVQTACCRTADFTNAPIAVYGDLSKYFGGSEWIPPEV